MRVVLAPDSFKGALSAVAACEAMAEGLRRVLPQAELRAIPLADGGEGTAAALVAASGGWLQSVPVCGPLPAERALVEGRLGWLAEGRVVVEMASASGLTLVSPERRNPLHTTSAGTGELIAAALAGGARELIVGLGGSATNDLGAGLAQALGVVFRRGDGSPILEPLCGGRLAEVAGLDLTGLHPGLGRCRLELACDVDNPLLGAHGATAVYGPQKGASAAIAAELEAGMAHLIALVERATGRRVSERPGAGAAGGAAAMLMALSGAEARPGIDLLLAASGFAAALVGADLVITGEGRVDAQTLRGKAIRGVARAAAAAGVPVVVLAGEIGPGASALHELGVTSLWSLVSGPMERAAAMAHAPELLANAAEQLARLLARLGDSGAAAAPGHA
ncbi:MAG: glycerate kinase [Cyanobacteriota bacterium]|nr:glycerate kinase [Cyanobacteriota bacterium]